MLSRLLIVKIKPKKHNNVIYKKNIHISSPKMGQCGTCQKGYRVVMVRHGQSEWNAKNIFTGWYDTPLTDKGRCEAQTAGKALCKDGYEFDICFTSVLRRAIETLTIILTQIRQTHLPVFATWRLNERHYGGLTGLNKSETTEKFGEKQVHIWRRSYDTPPPPMDKCHKYYNCIVNDPRYMNDPCPCDFPMTESLELTVKRTIPYWNKIIVPHIKKGHRVLIAAHGNSLRGICKHLDNISNDAIADLNLPTGIPFYYDLDDCMKPLPCNGSMQFLGDAETVKKAMEAVKNQAKKK